MQHAFPDRWQMLSLPTDYLGSTPAFFHVTYVILAQSPQSNSTSKLEKNGLNVLSKINQVVSQKTRTRQCVKKSLIFMN